MAAIGASAGGLEAYRTLLAALPPKIGMALILVQHLDPTHASMMVELLSPHTVLTVLEAHEDMRLEPDCVYIIPPGRYLAVHNGALKLSRPQGRQGVRMHGAGTGAVGKRGNPKRHVASAGDRPTKKGAQWGPRAP